LHFLTHAARVPPAKRSDSPATQTRNVLLALSRYNPAIHGGVARFAGQHDWHLNAEMTYFGHLPRGWKGDGIISLFDARNEIVEFVLSAGVPVVDLSLIRADIAVPRVVGDHFLIGRLGAEHFLERGFRHFAWFSTTDDGVTLLRWRGFSETLAHFGFSADRWIFAQPARKRTDEWAAKRHFLERRLAAAPKPLAVCTFRDADAANVLDACGTAGLPVPDEVAILGSDNNALICETVRVPLSSINHDLDRLGFEGAALLERLMKGKPPPRRTLLVAPRGITVRQSSEVLALPHGPTRQAMEYLLKHYSRSVDLDAAALAGGVSRRNMERAFREYLGHSMCAELARIRLNRAKALLRETRLSMTDVAARAGYNTPQYFNNVFRCATGQTPRRFRQRLNQSGSASSRSETRPHQLP
jgi:LacI family transcriptional regulator